jgi:hypothetical protein
MVHIHIVDCQKGYKVFVATIISCAKHACMHTFYIQERQLQGLKRLKKPPTLFGDNNKKFWPEGSVLYISYVHTV